MDGETKSTRDSRTMHGAAQWSPSKAAIKKWPPSKRRFPKKTKDLRYPRVASFITKKVRCKPKIPRSEDRAGSSLARLAHKKISLWGIKHNHEDRVIPCYRREYRQITSCRHHTNHWKNHYYGPTKAPRRTKWMKAPRDIPRVSWGTKRATATRKVGPRVLQASHTKGGARFTPKAVTLG